MVLFFMVEFLLFGIAAASWQTAHLYYATSKLWMANRGASPRNLFIRKKFNDYPSYRVGEASRAHPKGLALLPNISPSEMYQYRFATHKFFELVWVMT
jgi:hypothetical protein